MQLLVVPDVRHAPNDIGPEEDAEPDLAPVDHDRGSASQFAEDERAPGGDTEARGIPERDVVVAGEVDGGIGGSDRVLHVAVHSVAAVDREVGRRGAGILIQRVSGVRDTARRPVETSSHHAGSFAYDRASVVGALGLPGASG